MNPSRTVVRFLAVAVFFTQASLGRADKTSDDAPFWSGRPDAGAFEKAMDGRLDQARQALAQLVGVTDTPTVDNTLRPYNEVLIQLDAVSNQSSLMKEVHPDPALRATAEKVQQKVEAFSTELSLNPRVYKALTALDLAKADAETRYHVEKTLRDFRLAGVDKDEPTRKKVKALRDELVGIEQEFDRNIRDGLRKVTVKDAAELDGLPADFIARHKPDAAGTIALTIDYPDSLPVLQYARSEDLRRRMYTEFNNRAYPKNLDVLDRMIARRHELATLLGFPHWADYITADKMVKSAKNASDFIDRIVEASGPRARRDYEALLKRKQKDVPGATSVNAWEKAYWEERLHQSDYAFDSQKVRPYFPYERVKQGVLDVTGKMFGVSYRRVKDAPVWHPAVECYEMFENGQLVGRFYWDMHPRPGKYNHAAQFSIRTGVAGRQIPETALVCNFPGGEAGDPGLMEHDDVTTFFHEFGHLLHFMFAGRHRWVGVGGISTEWDFVEAPSQMLEEWSWDPLTLATFAKHYQTGAVIPPELVKQMKRASEFGKGLDVRRQMVYARLSLSIHDRPPAEVHTDAVVKALTERYSPIAYVEGTHFQCGFGHLNGYSAIYYTYMWSLVIAKDLYSQFDHSNLLAPGVARRYRDAVLAPGGSQPADKLVEHFLGRPFDFKAWQAWLDKD